MQMWNIIKVLPARPRNSALVQIPEPARINNFNETFQIRQIMVSDKIPDYFQVILGS
jgi:hypothetical protein